MSDTCKQVDLPCQMAVLLQWLRDKDGDLAAAHVSLERYREALASLVATYDFTYLDRKAIASDRDKLWLKARAVLSSTPETKP
jgi:hypothetical protein